MPKIEEDASFPGLNDEWPEFSQAVDYGHTLVYFFKRMGDDVAGTHFFQLFLKCVFR